MTMDALMDELLSGVHTFVRVGYDKKRLSFIPGCIMQGRSNTESRWKFTLVGDLVTLDIYDVDGNRTYRLTRSGKGLWKGRMECGEMMPVELFAPNSGPSRAVIIQQGDGEFAKMLRLTHTWHSEYAEQHAIDFWSVVGEPQTQRDSHWNKIVLIRQALEMDYHLIVWLDADTLIVHPEQDIRNARAEFSCVGMCKHNLAWGTQGWHFNSGVIFINNCQQSDTFFQSVWDSGPVCHPWHEQVRILECAQQMPDVVQVIHDRWNSSDSSNPTPSPVIKAWHGISFPAHRLVLMGDALLACQAKRNSLEKGTPPLAGFSNNR